MNLLKDLDSQEAEVYKAAKNGKPVFTFSGQSREDLSNFLFDRIKSISGVMIGTLEDADEATNEVLSFITTTPAFKVLTATEIITAFRMNASGDLGDPVEHFNKIINCDYVGKVLRKYVDVRRRVHQKIEHHIPPQHTHLTDQPIAEKAVLVETAEAIYRKTKLYGLIPVDVYDILEEQGSISFTNDQKAEIRFHMERKLENDAALGGLNEMRRFKLLQEDEVAWENRVRSECKKKAAAMYFDKKIEDDMQKELDSKRKK